MTVLYSIGVFILAVFGAAATFLGGALAMDRYSAGAAIAVTAFGVMCLVIAFLMVGLN